VDVGRGVPEDAPFFHLIATQTEIISGEAIRKKSNPSTISPTARLMIVSMVHDRTYEESDHTPGVHNRDRVVSPIHVQHHERSDRDGARDIELPIRE
jgi:hypothetical protein